MVMQDRDGYTEGDLERQLAIGLDWLIHGAGPQPDGALIQHHGVGANCGGGLRVNVTPYFPVREGAATNGVVNVSTAVVNYGRSNEYRPPSLSDSEIAYVRDLIGQKMTVVESWRADLSHSYLVSGVDPSVRQLVSTYLAGDPAHNGSTLGGGSWFQDGHAQAKLPKWHNIQDPAPGMTKSEMAARNLRAIREAIEEWAPKLDLGPVALYAPGQRGEISSDNTRFETDGQQGHGVCIPAEVFVQMARASCRLAGEDVL